jgi:phosphatidate cytidylyltransferase
MIGLFIATVLAGHVYLMTAVMIIATVVYREIILIGLGPVQELKVLPWFRSLHWFFYFVTIYFLYIGSLIRYFEPSVFVGRFLMPFVTHHEMLSFLLYMGGFVTFVVNLRKGFYRFQFYQ